MSVELWPGETVGITGSEARRRWAQKDPGLIVEVDGQAVPCAVSSPSIDEDGLAVRVVARVGHLDHRSYWTTLSLRTLGSTREISGHVAGMWMGSLYYRCEDGWARVDLVPGDPERLAWVVLRSLAQIVGVRPSRGALEVAVAGISERYRVTHLERADLRGAA